MKAIETKYHGPTDTRGSRITATDNDGHRISNGYSYELNSEAAHFEAAKKLAGKLGWAGEMVAGWTKNGYVFVWVNGTHYHV